MGRACVDKHKVVFLTYRIRDLDGQLHEQVDLPIGYVHGANSNLFEQIEQALDGHVVGDTIEVQLSPKEGFGERRPDLTYTDAVENVPPEVRRLGAEAEFQNDRGETITMVVSRIEDGQITLDGNHPLAGKAVIFEVTITDIRDATAEEIARGIPEGGQLLH